MLSIRAIVGGSALARGMKSALEADNRGRGGFVGIMTVPCPQE